MRGVHNEHVGPLSQFLENLLSARGFQIERDAALVPVRQVPLIGILRLRVRREAIPNSPAITGRGLNLDHVSAKVAQDHGAAWTRDEAREIHYFQSGKNIVCCHFYLL